MRINQKYTIEEIKQYILDHDTNHECELLSTNYINNNTPLELKCNLCGKNFQRTFTHIKDNRFCCPTCGRAKGGKARKGAALKYSLDDVKQDIAKDGYIIIGDYINADTNVLCQCKNGHQFNLKYSRYRRGESGCAKCHKLQRLEEKKNQPLQLGRDTIELTKYLRDSLLSWKTACLQNSNYTCDISGIQGKDLEVHHLINFTDLVNETFQELNLPIRRSYLDYTPEQLLQIVETLQSKHDINTGVVILKKYHKQFHHIYGVKNNTKEQYEKFKYLIQNKLL